MDISNTNYAGVMMDKNIEQIFVDIIQRYMNLPNDYGYTASGNLIPCVTIANQNIKLFNTDKLQITVKTLTTNVYASRSEFKEVLDGYIETIYLNEQKQMQIDIYSKNNDARERYFEVTASLKSTIAQEQEDLYNFKIAKISKTVNLSGLDGSADISRYTVTFNVLTHDKKETYINYYDKFPLQVYTEQGKIYSST